MCRRCARIPAPAGAPAGTAPSAAAARWARDPDTIQAARVDLELVSDLLRGRVKDHYAPLVKRLLGKAYYENNSDFPQAQEPLAAE